EKHPPAARRDVAHRMERPMQRRHRLLQIDDMDAVADAENIGRHLRVPAPRMMAEMHAGLEKLAHRETGHGHGRWSFLRFSRRGGYRSHDTGAASRAWRPHPR